MTVISIGDGLRQFQLARHSSALKTDLSRLTSEMTSGEVSDRAKAVGGRTSELSGITHRLSVLSSYSQNTNETSQLLASVQRVLGSLDGQRDALASDLLLINADSAQAQVNQAGENALGTFADMVGKINARHAGRSLFAGAAVDQPALATPDVIMTALQTVTAPHATADAKINAINDWFDDPAGYAATAYVGDAGDTLKRQLSASDSVSLDFRGDDPELKSLLKATAIGALTAVDPTMDRDSKAALLSESAVALQSASSSIAQLQSRVGFAEMDVARVGTAHTAEVTVLSQAKNAYIQADPFETATELQALQVQLETHYTITARLSRLNLTSYL